MKIFLALFAALFFLACDNTDYQPKSTTGVQKATAQVVTQANGLTVEQENVKNRLEQENQPGTIKHLYVISAYTGDIILYSTVKGKVTSSSKRLTPNTVFTGGASSTCCYGIPINIGGSGQMTGEVLQDDGTYGSSIEYLYWWDVQGRYHQHYPAGGQIIHISDQSIGARKAIINLEATK